MVALSKLTKCVAVAFLLFPCSRSFAQNGTIGKFILNSLHVNEKKYLSDEYKGRNFLFSVAFGTDRKGLVDTILYDRNIMGLNEIVDFGSFKNNLTKENTSLINHKNKFFVAYVYLSRGFDEPITNGEILMSSWINLNKGFSKAQANRALVLLSPILMIYGGKTIKN